AEGRALLDEGEIDAFLADSRLTYADDEAPDLTEIVTQALLVLELRERLQGLGLSPQEQQELLTPREVQVVLADPDDANAGERHCIGSLGALSPYVTLAIYGSWILTGVVEEKSSRVVEVMLGLVRPQELLTGKTLGILIVAVGQLVV